MNVQTCYPVCFDFVVKHLQLELWSSTDLPEFWHKCDVTIPYKAGGQAHCEFTLALPYVKNSFCIWHPKMSVPQMLYA